jgi:hypothetical protein
MGRRCHEQRRRETGNTAHRTWKLALAVIAVAIAAILAGTARADVLTLTAENMTIAGNTITGQANVLGAFDGRTAYTTNTVADGSEIRLPLINGTALGTLVNWSVDIRMNVTPAMANDIIYVEISNDSGTYWTTMRTITITNTSLNTLTNLFSQSIIFTMENINNTMVRLRYAKSGGVDNVRIGIDGVQFYAKYAPPPSVALNTPGDNAGASNGGVSFNFTPSSILPAGFANCSLYINGAFSTANQTPIVNSTPNYINITLNDGDYTWNVTCYDAARLSGTSAQQRTLRVSRPPVIGLVLPPDNGINPKSIVNFTFNVTAFAGITSCALVVDDTVRSTIPSPARGVNVSVTSTLSLGDHLWYVNCTDVYGTTNQSRIWKVTVQVTTPTLITDRSIYEQGSTIQYNGSNWQAGADVMLNVTLPNGTTQTYSLIAGANGKINMTQLINFSYPVGVYYANASQLNDTDFNASTSFTIQKRLVNLTLDGYDYLQGDDVNITGQGYAPGSLINITVNFTGGQVTIITSANSSGGFNYIYTLPYAEALGKHNVSAVDRNYSTLNANNSFNVNKRVASLATNKTRYSVNESVGITGLGFSRYGIISLQIFSTATSKPATGYPLTLAANSTGGFDRTWTVNSTCSGNYTMQAGDQDYPLLNATATFVINNSLAQSIRSVTDGVSGNRVTPVLSYVTTSDTSRQIAGVTQANGWGYLQFTFHPGIPLNATGITASATVQHMRSANKNINWQMYFVNASGQYQLAGGGCSGTLSSSTEIYSTCDFSAYAQTSTAANGAVIMVNYSTTNTVDAQVNYAYMDISWTGDPYGCFEFGNSPAPPVVSNIMVPGNPVVLNAGSARSVECNFTVTDPNGAGTIGANATFFTAPSTSGSALSNVSKYDATSCIVVSADAVSKNYECTADLLYYAANGTWTCLATGFSAGDVDATSAQFTVDPLFAINITDAMLDFGNLSTGTTSENITTNATNIGNQRVNISAYAYGASTGDGNSFSCATQNISAMWLHFAANDTATYDQKENITSSLQQLRLQINPQDDPSLIRTNSTYWQLQIPDNMTDTGACAGVIVFQADPS